MLLKLKMPFLRPLPILFILQIICMAAVSQDADNLKLKDFRPVSIFKVPQSKIIKAKYPVIGFHDGKLRWLRSIGTVQQDSNGSDTFFTGIINDITEQKADEQRKNDFIGMVSHELKTPLTSLTAIVQVANAKLKNSEDQFLAGAMEKANQQVKRMSKMINGFLNVSRLESARL